MSDFFHTVERVFHDWNYSHPKVLYGLIRALHPNVVVEVGTYRGYAAAYMAKAIQENNHGRLYGIDSFQLSNAEGRPDPVEHWRNNLRECGVLEWTTLLVGKSDNVKWPAQVDFAYIDGWHSYEQTKKDFEQCARRGAELIAFDDVKTIVGPRMLLNEIRASGEWDVITLRRDGGLGLCYRRAPLGPVTFSQEIPDHAGKYLNSPDQIREHLDELRPLTKMNYTLTDLL